MQETILQQNIQNSSCADFNPITNTNPNIVISADAETNRVADYIQKLGIKYTCMARATGIPEGILRRSLIKRERSLRAGEFLAVCQFLERAPLDFARDTGQTGT